MSREKAIDDATFVQVVGSHLDFYSVAGKDTYAMDAHAARQVTVQLMIFRLFTRDTDAERGIGKRFFHDADEFNNILGHRESRAERADASYRASFAAASLWAAKKCESFKFMWQTNYFMV